MVVLVRGLSGPPKNFYSTKVEVGVGDGLGKPKSSRPSSGLLDIQIVRESSTTRRSDPSVKLLITKFFNLYDSVFEP